MADEKITFMGEELPKDAEAREVACIKVVRFGKSIAVSVKSEAGATLAEYCAAIIKTAVALESECGIPAGMTLDICQSAIRDGVATGGVLLHG